MDISKLAKTALRHVRLYDLTILNQSRVEGPWYPITRVLAERHPVHLHIF